MAFSNIVVAVDGSEASQEALNHAVDLARQSHSALTGLFVIDSGWPDYIGNDWQSSRNSRQGFLDYIHDEQKQQADAAARQFAGATQSTVACKFVVLAGDPVDILLEQTRNDATDLLILGRRTFQVSGRPSLKTLAKKVTANPRIPVMLFP
jgi:nucleotide-binding universal stress UspA family protein